VTNNQQREMVQLN